MPKIVVVEDQQVLATVYRNKFVAEGYQVEVASDGEAGLALINTTQPDLVILDLILPKMNGIAVLRHIRASDPTLPVIIISGFATPGQLDEARRLGVTEIISKPHILTHFTDALARAANVGGGPSGPFTG